MSQSPSDIPTLCISEKPIKSIETKLEDKSGSIGEPELKWNQDLPMRIKKVIWIIKENSSKIYESTTPKTMKYLALISSLILFFAVLSLVLAQRDEAAQSKYGMAFPIEESASNKAEKRVAASLTVSAAAANGAGVPGESGSPEATTLPSTPPASSSSDDSKSGPTDPAGITEEESKGEGTDIPVSLINGDEEDKPDNGDRNPRIVFIERLMGLHVSAPARPSVDGSGPDQDKESSDASPSASSAVNGGKNPLDKVNAKWASRMRKFSIPIPSSTDSQQQQSPASPLLSEQPNPILRYAAAAMMSRLVAAAARAQMEAQAREAMNNQLSARIGGGKDKDEEADDETVPVIVATMRDDRAGPGGLMRPLPPPMYGRPMPRGPIVRPPHGPQHPPMMPFTVHQHQPLGRSMPTSLPSMPQRAYLAPPPQQPQAQARGPVVPMVTQRPRIGRSDSNPNVQPVLVMLAVPVQSAESRSSPAHVQIAPMAAASAGSLHYPVQSPAPVARAAHAPFYPTVPYSIPYARPHYQSASYAVPVHVPVPVNYPYYQHRPAYQYGPVQRQMAAYSHVRPVIEVPVEVPVPYHVPVQVPVTMRSMGYAGAGYAAYPGHPGDHEPSSSDQDHIVLLYDAEIHHADGNGGDDLEQSALDNVGNNQQGTKLSPPFLSQAMPQIASANKMKLWRELINAKHATQSGVRFIPISVAQEESQQQGPPAHYPQPPHPTREQTAETVHQPTFIVLADQDDQH